MKLYNDQFSEDLDQPAFSGQPRFLLIASTPRCGSHMLGHAMAATDRLGVPFEYINPANLAEWRRRLGTATPRATLEALIARRTTPNGVFCLKAHYDQCAVLGGAGALFDMMPGLRAVHIRRADVLRQAISFSVAIQTGVWISGQEAESDRAEYDFPRIQRCLNSIAVQNARWKTTLRSHGVPCLDLLYEDARANLSAAVTAIARDAGVIDADVTLPAETRTARQASQTRTEDWIARYAAEYRPKPPLLRRVRGRLRRLLNG